MCIRDRYEVGRIFRNEGMDTKHNPEFTTCELYQAYTNLDGMMDILEGILSGACKEIHGGYQVQWLGHDIDLTPGWPRVTMADAVKNVTGADFMACIGDADKGVELALSLIHISMRCDMKHDFKFFVKEGAGNMFSHGFMSFEIGRAHV